MKPTLLILLVFLAVPLFDLAQSACPEAQKYIDKRKAEEEKGKTIINAPLECYSDWAKYYVLKCQCEQGVESKEEAKNLADRVNANLKYLIRLEKTECKLGEVLPEPVTSCKVNEKSNSPNQNQNNSNTNQQTAPTLNYTGYEEKNQRLKDEYLRTFSKENTFNAYVSGENIRRSGVALAKQLSNGLDRIDQKIKSRNPKNILSEFNQKMQNIEQLEAQFNEQDRQYSFEAGSELGKSIGSEDWEGALHQAAGILNARAEQKKVQAELEAKRAELRRQRHNKMVDIYWKAVDFNKAQQQQYLNAAAFAKDETDEKYNLAFVENLDCFLESMDANFSSLHSEWLINNCPIPEKPNLLNVINSVSSEDEKLIDIAKRKYDLFQKYEENVFRDAAISFASAAVSIKPKSSYFLLLSEYYRNYSSLLEFSNILAAKAYDPNSINSESKQRLSKLRSEVEEGIVYAIDNNSLDYISTFLNSGLEREIKIDQQNILVYSISTDKPDPVQTILNHRIESLSPKQQIKEIQRAVMLSVTYNSDKILLRLGERGVNFDFVLQKTSPVDLADEIDADKSLAILLTFIDDKEKYSDIMKNSFQFNYYTFISHFKAGEHTEAGSFLNDIENESVFKNVITTISDSIIDIPSLVHPVSKSPRALNLITKDYALKKNFSNAFFYNFFYSLVPDLDVFIYNDLVELDENLDINESVLSALNSTKNGINTGNPYGYEGIGQDDYLKTINTIKSKFRSIRYFNKVELDTFENSFEMSDNTDVGRVNWFDVFTMNNIIDYWFDENGKLDNQIDFCYAPWSDFQTFNKFVSRIREVPVADFNPEEISLFSSFSVKSECIPTVQGKRVDRGYAYENDLGSCKEKFANPNLILDLPAFIKKNFLQSYVPKNLLKTAIFKRDAEVVSAIIDHHNISLNTNVDGEPLFLVLAQSMNWLLLNKLMAEDNTIDLSKVDRYGNTVFHYLGEYSWVFRQVTKYYPEYLIPNLLNLDFDRSVLKIKNEDYETPWQVFNRKRHGRIWAKSYRNRMKDYLKP